MNQHTEEMLSIAHCPLCGKPHSYSIEIQRSKYLFGREDTQPKRKIKRLLTCPTKNEFYEATLDFKSDGQGLVQKVNVKGVLNDKEN